MDSASVFGGLENPGNHQDNQDDVGGKVWGVEYCLGRGEEENVTYQVKDGTYQQMDNGRLFGGFTNPRKH